MKRFTGWEYLLLDAANHFGLDKETFEIRLSWAQEKLPELETLVSQADNPVQYQKAVMAIRRAQQGEPIGHLVAFDAVCSGIQIMSALTGCESGARATGLIDPDVRADAYSYVTQATNKRLQAGGMTQVSIPRADIKYAVMTACYGSSAVPKRLFGEDTPELEAFEQACYDVAPGAFELLQDLLDSWRPYALEHSWQLPDGFQARIKVMQPIETKIEVDELDHATFTYYYTENKGSKKEKANAANVVHSIDAYILRSLVRRCNYDPTVVRDANYLITWELLGRNIGIEIQDPISDHPAEYYARLWERTGMADVVILPYIDELSVRFLPTELLFKLNGIIDHMMTYKPFPVITIHDSFAAHANNVNEVRHWYKEILAELSESEVLTDIFNQIHGADGHYPKKSTSLGDKIRKSNYALS